jgi:hypothetical protein
MKLPLLSADQKLAEIRRLYYRATPRTIQQDLSKAVALLRSMGSDEERQRAAVYMDGLSEMRSDWTRAAKRRSGRR